MLAICVACSWAGQAAVSKSRSLGLPILAFVDSNGAVFRRRFLIDAVAAAKLLEDARIKDQDPIGVSIC